MQSSEGNVLLPKNSSPASTPEPNDSLWTAMKNGDRRAFTELMEQHYRPLFSYGTKLTFDKEVVRDCIQDVFLEIWRRRQEIAVAESPRFYLLRSLQRKIHHEIVRNQVFYQSSEVDLEANFAVEFSIEADLIGRQEQEQNAVQLTQLINKLSPRQKQVIYLRFYQDLDYDEIAAFMDLNRQSVYNLLGEAVSKLRKFWQSSLVLLALLLTELKGLVE